MDSDLSSRPLDERQLSTKGFTILCIVFLLLAAAAASYGQTWTGGGSSDDWGDGGNWSGGAPSSSGSAILNFAGTARLQPWNNYANYTQFQSIFFNAGAGAFTLRGNAIKLFGNIQNDSSSLQTINFGSSGEGKWGFVGGNNADRQSFHPEQR